MGLHVALSMDGESFAGARRVTILSVSGVLGVGLNLRLELPSDTFKRRMIGQIFALAGPRFLVSGGCVDLRRLECAEEDDSSPWFASDVDFCGRGEGRFRRLKVPPFCAKRGLGLCWLPLITNC